MGAPSPDLQPADYWSDVERIFASVAALDPDAADAALAALCADRPDLRAEVESLLAAHARATRFLAAQALSADVAVEDRSRLGERIGSFTLAEHIASGGMGSVYRAERVDRDFTQQVAVKLIAAPMAHPESARRFRAERQILAALHHPHIVALLDGGITAAGEAYLVMEYVDGEPLSTYCRRRALPLRARLELFRDVCGAVHYLHQHFVIHRDLKPTNILVTRDGVPKVVDFGIAKLIEDPAVPGAEGLTRLDERPLTPNYASPEQLRGLAVTVASDLYSLGVLLYELLTGARPHETTGKPLDETLRLVLETNPARPSEAAAAEVLPYDRRSLRGDLDAIVLRAIRKEPEERYPSARALADDLGRYLRGEPVDAREPSLGYVLRRLAARHRAVFITAAASLVIIVGLLVVSIWQARVARVERDRAEARFEDVRRLANSVIYELHDAIANLPGATEARRLLVSRALEYLDRLSREARTDAEFKRELADAYQRVAEVQNGGLGANVGGTAAALESYRKALVIRQSLVTGDAADPRDIVGLAMLDFDLGALLRVQGQPEAAETSFLSSARRFEQLRASGRLQTPPRSLATIYQRLAEVQLFQGKTDLALASSEKAVAEAESLWNGGRRDASTRSALAASLYQLGDVLGQRGRVTEALARTREARTMLEAALRENPLDAQQTRILLYALNGEHTYLAQIGDVRASIAVAERALEVAQDASRRDPSDNWIRIAVGVAAKTLGVALVRAGDEARGIERLRLSLATATRAAVEDAQNGYVRLEVASAQHELGRALVTMGGQPSTAEGCALLRRVQSFWSGLNDKGELPSGEAVELPRIPQLLARCS